MLSGNPLKAVAALLSQFTTLQAKLTTAVEGICARRDARLDAIRSLEAEVAECEVVCAQAENAIKGIDKLLSGK